MIIAGLDVPLFNKPRTLHCQQLLCVLIVPMRRSPRRVCSVSTRGLGSMVDWSLSLYSWVSFEWFCCASCVLTLRGFCTIGCLHLYSVLPYGSLTLILSVGYPFTAVLLSDYHDLYRLGRVLNRFSKDVGFLDDLLPFIFVQYTVVRPIYTLYVYTVLYRIPHFLDAAATEMLGYHYNCCRC